MKLKAFSVVALGFAMGLSLTGCATGGAGFKGEPGYGNPAYHAPGEYGGNRPAQAPIGFGQVGMTNQPVVRMPYGYNGQPGYAITPGYGGTVNTPAQIKICGNPFGCR